MLLPVQHVLDSLARELERQQQYLADANVEASSVHGMATALKLLQNRQRGGAAFLKDMLDALGDAAKAVAAALESEKPELAVELRALADSVSGATGAASLELLESAWTDAARRFEALLAGARAAANVDSSLRARVSRIAVDWESDMLLRQAAEPETSAESSDNTSVRVDAENLKTYLADRLGASEPTVRSVKPLPGGFGKETILFDVESDSLDGSFVMRRDLPADTGLANDCHRTELEYPVIKAVRERGYPAPDALWLDTEHRLIPGGNFIVMRRAPGVSGGSFFGASVALPDHLPESLAQAAATLHSLPPMTGLGDLTESIRDDWWRATRGECVRRYIEGWYRMYLDRAHMPSPAIVGLYGWLLDHIPERDGAPSLIHGDLGFHNFLFDDDELSAVLDWEFAHVGDPAEELGYIRVTAGHVLDWDRFMQRYEALGGDAVSPEVLLFFQAWAYLRNASAASLVTNCFMSGGSDELKLTVLPHAHIPQFLRGAQELIDEYQRRFS